MTIRWLGTEVAHKVLIICPKRGAKGMVRSLDVQQLFLQSNAVERVQQVQQMQGDTQQRHIQAQLLQERKELREKVKEAEEAHCLVIREDQERERREGFEEDSGAKKDGEEGADFAESEGRIDIRV